MMIHRCASLSGLLAGAAFAATFGTVVPLTGGASDLALDEARGRIYLVNTNRNEIDIYAIAQRRFLAPITVDSTPLSAAMSRDGKFLYITCNTAASLNVINLDTSTRVGRVSLPDKPEGVAVGNDNRVLISTSGTGFLGLQNVLLIYNPGDGSVLNVVVTPAPPQNPILPAPSNRPALALRSQLRATPDGALIIGVNIATATTQSVFVYETASSVVLRSRRVTNISNVLAVSPDGSTFMAGLTLFDTSTLNVIAQENLANSSYPISTANTANFNTQANQGGSIFSPSGDTIYSAFNITPTANPPARANVSQFLFNDSQNLLISEALQLPENLAGKMAITADGGTVYALSDSGFLQIPLSQLSGSPLVAVDSTIQLMTNDQCGVMAGQTTKRVTISNAGKGRLTATASLIQATTGPAQLGGGGGGGIIIIIFGGPGGGTAIGGGFGPTSGSNMATAPAVRTTPTSDGAQFDFTFNNSLKSTIGTASPLHDYLIQSPEAVNLPPRVRILQNSRNSEARGTIVPIPVGVSANQGLQDLYFDSARGRIYIANAGMNRIEIYDTKQQKMLDPVKVGQLPQSMAVTPDGGTMYVANGGGENISIIDVASMKKVGNVVFPATPFDATVTLVTPTMIAATERGALFLMNNGTLWSIIGKQAVPRRPSSVLPSTAAGAQTPLTAPYTLAASPAGEYVIVSSGNGSVYLYDALIDDFVQARQIQTNPIRGYRGPLTVGPKGQYFVVNGILLNSALTPVADVPSVISVTNGQTTTTNIPIAAVSMLSPTQYARFSQPVRLTANANTTAPPTIEIVDINTGAVRNSVPALEAPLSQVANANTATTIAGRTMAIDMASNNAYLITTSGLSVIPLDTTAAADRPVLSARATTNIASGGTTVAANNLVVISGRNLAADATAPTTGNLPTILGGVCVTMGITPIPLLMTSATQINAQIPPGLATGNQQLTVRSIANHASTAAQAVAISMYAPAVMLDAKSQVQL